MPEFIAAISDRLRVEGYSEDVSGIVKQVVVRPDLPHPTIIEERRDEFRSKENDWSVTIGDSMIALVTTNYERFPGFSARLSRVLATIDEIAGIRNGQIHRIGLRYVDVIKPAPDETVEQYLQPSLHGPTTPKSGVFVSKDRLLAVESVGRTGIGVMRVRISQNNQGMLIPPDCVFKPMKHKMQASGQEMITLFDTDHFTEGNWDFDADRILNTVDLLHKGINAAWFEDFITEHALQAWEAEQC